MRVLVACEFSGVVRRAFRERGHDAWSNDILPAEDDGPHLQGDIFKVLTDRKYQRMGSCEQVPSEWDMLLFFWRCTNMCVSGARWFHLKRKEQAEDVEAFIRLAEWPIAKVAGENPIGVLSTKYRKPDQIIQPWMFGHGETKATCIWKRGLPDLLPTNIVDGRHARVHREPPSPDRWKNRSRTLPGIAEAMAEQWGSL